MADDEHTSNWYPGPHVSLGSGAWLARLRWIIDAFEQRLGISVPPSSRLRNAQRLLAALQDGRLRLTPADDALTQRVLDAHQTVWQFFVIANAIGRKPARTSTVFTKEKLSLALSGADLEDDDTNHLPRNTQFELFVASVFVLGGAEVAGGEPDLRVLYWGEMRGVACKRIRSLSPAKLDRHAKVAAAQVSAATQSGFMAINIDVLYRDASLPKSEPERLALFDEKVRHTLFGIDGRLVAAPHVLAVLVFGSCAELRFDSTGPHLDAAFPTSFILTSDDDQPEAAQRAAIFFRGLLSRWQNAIERLGSAS